MSSEPVLSIVLPCYNEAGNIPLIFSRFREVLGDRKDVEVVMVDNGSRDNSQEIFAEQLADPQHGFARLVTVKDNKGYGFGIMEGIRACRGTILSWTHADMQTDPNDVLLGFSQISSQANPASCFLKGRRIGRNPLDAFFTWGMSVISTWKLKARVSDVNAQPKMFHRSFLEHLSSPPDDFSLDLYVYFLAIKHNLTLLEQPVSFKQRQHGEAKGGGTLKGKYKLIKRTFGYINLLKKGLEEGTY